MSEPLQSPEPESSPLSVSGPVSGDFATFFRTTLAPLRRYLARLVGSNEEAQDIAQTAYAKVFTVMQDRRIEHPQALLYKTARNLAIDELKHRSRAPFDEREGSEFAVSPTPSVEAIVMGREESVILGKSIDQLPVECRTVLLLRMGESLTHEEIALRMGLTRKQVEKRLYRAVQLLHVAMRRSPPKNPTP